MSRCSGRPPLKEGTDEQQSSGRLSAYPVELVAAELVGLGQEGLAGLAHTHDHGYGYDVADGGLPIVEGTTDQPKPPETEADEGQVDPCVPRRAPGLS